MQQRGGDRGIHSAGEAQQDTSLADLGADTVNGMRDEVPRGPIGLHPADAKQEVPDDVDAALSMENLGMELDAVEPAAAVLDNRVRRVLGGASGLEARGQPGELVAVRVPDAQLAREPGEQGAGPLHREHAVAVLARLTRRDLTAEKVPHQLHAIANAEDRHAEAENLRVRVRRLAGVHALRPAR